MSKRSKQPSPKTTQLAKPLAGGIEVAQAPAKQPTLLGVSIILFALWFVFLLVTAIFG